MKPGAEKRTIIIEENDAGILEYLLNKHVQASLQERAAHFRQELKAKGLGRPGVSVEIEANLGNIMLLGVALNHLDRVVPGDHSEWSNALSEVIDAGNSQAAIS